MHPKKIWFLFLLQLVIITDIVSLRKNFLLKITAEIGIINTFGQCFKYISTDSVDPREGQGKKDFLLSVCVLFLSGFASLPIIFIFQAVFNLESLASGRKLYLKQITQLCSTRKLQYLILEFDSEQLNWGQ